MGDNLGKAFSEIMVIASSIVGLAIVAVLVSQRANTANVIKAAGNAFGGALQAATSPVTGSSFAGGGFSSF